MQRAFTLFELLVVVLIMGVLYSVFIEKLEEKKSSETVLNLENLREFLVAKRGLAQDATLVCVDDCHRCFLYRDQNRSEEISSFLDKDVKLYRYSYVNGLRQEDLGVLFLDSGEQKEICFAMHVNSEGVMSPYLVAYKGIVYDFSTFFHPLKRYDSLEEARDAKEHFVEELQ